MPGSLRDRKKAATMHRIQETAVGLFEERGFDAVTIEEVAAAAEVSPSTVYRYFGTKEGLVLHDEHDEVLMSALAEALRVKDLWTVVEEVFELIAHDHFVVQADLTLRRTRLWFETPAVRNATYAVIDAMVDEITGYVAASPQHDYTEEEARVVVTAQVWGIVAAIEAWLRAGGETPLGEHLRAALPLIRPERR